MLPVISFRQTPGYCGPACMVMIFDYYGIKITEKKLATLTHASRSTGTTAENMIQVAKDYGFKTQLKDTADFKDIKHFLNKKIPVIVNWFSPYGEPEGHYSVVVGMDSNNIYLQNPELGYIQSIRLSTFKRLWFDFKGDYIQSKNDLFLRRMIVMYL
jgi:ABC-type bacteriocin/lantibiotic exporter with double-glycine peptidase domain